MSEPTLEKLAVEAAEISRMHDDGRYDQYGDHPAESIATLLDYIEALRRPASGDDAIAAIVKDLRDLQQAWRLTDVDDRNALTAKWRGLLTTLRRPPTDDAEVENIRQCYYDFTNGEHKERPNWMQIATLINYIDDLRRPVVQSQEVENLRFAHQQGTTGFYKADIDLLFSSLDAAQREIEALKGPALKCTHCQGKGTTEPFWMCDVEEWSSAGTCGTCGGTGELRTAGQYLKTVPADWNKDSSLETWFPLTAEQLQQQAAEIARLSAPPEERGYIAWALIQSRNEYRASGQLDPGNAGEALEHIDTLLQDLARYRNAHIVVMGERDRAREQCQAMEAELSDRRMMNDEWQRNSGECAVAPLHERIQRLEAALRKIRTDAPDWSTAYEDADRALAADGQQEAQLVLGAGKVIAGAAKVLAAMDPDARQAMTPDQGARLFNEIYNGDGVAGE